MSPSLPRPTPCATCPYRANVPSGVWHPDEYSKLPPYDAPTHAQPFEAFGCHQQDGSICAGWLGCHDPQELMAVRIGIMSGRLDPSCATYRTDVPLHPSGTAAAEHGLADVDEPDDDAQAAIDKLLRQRGKPNQRGMIHPC